MTSASSTLLPFLKGSRPQVREVNLLSLLFKKHSTRMMSSTADRGGKRDDVEAQKKRKTFRDRARESFHERREKARANFRKRRDKAIKSYTESKENLQQSYEEFKEHPRESAIAGAKTFSGMMRMYGPVFLGTYFTIYLATLGSLYGGVSSGALDPVQLFSYMGMEKDGADSTVHLVVDFMQNHTLTAPYADWVLHNPQVANIGVAWIATKFTEPLRIPIALFLTPRVARSLGYGPRTSEETGSPPK